MKIYAKLGSWIICILIILIGVTGCNRNDNNLTPVTGNDVSNLTPAPSANEMNGSANLAKGGFAAMQDGWIYYGFKNSLYKMKADGSKKLQIYKVTKTPYEDGFLDCISEINVLGDWIYYNYFGDSIYRIKTDGTGKEELYYASQLEKVNVVKNQVYFSGYGVNLDEGSDDWSLCKINVREKKEQVLRYYMPSYPNLHFVNGWIYFYKREIWDKNQNVFKMRTDGTEKQLAMEDKTYDYTVAGDWIYYLTKNKRAETNKLYKIKTDGTESQMLAEGNNIDTYKGLNVAGNWIYYLVATSEDDDLYKLYKIKTDGTECQMIAEEINVDYGNINIVGNWIFYEAFEKDGDDYHDVLYRMKTDGTDKEIVAK